MVRDRSASLFVNVTDHFLQIRGVGGVGPGDGLEVVRSHAEFDGQREHVDDLRSVVPGKVCAEDLVRAILEQNLVAGVLLADADRRSPLFRCSLVDMFLRRRLDTWAR